MATRSEGPGRGSGRALELRVPPLLLAALTALAMAGLAFALPELRVALPARRWVAGLLLALGASTAFAGVLAFRRHRTTVNPLAPGTSSALVATGLYRLSRNPMYLGMLLVLAGWGAWLANGAAACLLPAFVAYMNRFQIAPEERALRAKFGDAFAAYAASTRRWL